ncbi:hypothetical protein BT96DRAFT_714644 [Gymnopus androsaceus JB14]|uniref:Uncharacterized protein n=1 Tax=Gymnopus androsaceus JB14 TaxID=1447944 RepID=A0A6A4HLJ1_9AGAR|nr:hypothetical protein BT96DRAFT_714644 [Gymnopus androsaceus JB14]
MARRDWGPGIRDMIEGLIKAGIAFNTLVPHKSGPSSGMSKLRAGQGPAFLGYRSVDFKPGLAEYRAYEHRRDQLLRSPRGRAAILAGGVIARLARDVVNIGDVFDGPTEEAFYGEARGLHVWDGKSEIAYRDDQLTEDEVNLICGTYDVATNNTGTAFKSWWPRPSSWKLSGLNAGFWSKDAEVWFQKRLEKIRKNNATIHTNNEWRSSVKFNRETANLAAKNDAFSAEYLDLLFLFPGKEGKKDTESMTVMEVIANATLELSS